MLWFLYRFRWYRRWSGGVWFLVSSKKRPWKSAWVRSVYPFEIVNRIEVNGVPLIDRRITIHYSPRTFGSGL